VSKLKNENCLFDEDLAYFLETSLEKLVIVDQIACEHEFGLESGPNRVRLLAAAIFAGE
jgi:hypothetical protein